MTIESQLERICVALEALAAMHAGPLVTINADVLKAETKPKGADPAAVKKIVEDPMRIEPKAEVTKEEPIITNAASFDDLADKVKALGQIDRPAVMALFEKFGIKRLNELKEDQYIAFDIAIAKATNKAKGG